METYNLGYIMPYLQLLNMTQIISGTNKLQINYELKEN